ncbi:hypothetical protein D9M68_877220 [compost metagenome]
MPIRKKFMANSVNTPCTSEPSRKRRTSSITNSTPENSDRIVPIAENHCSGTIEKPVTRSKFRRISWYSEYFDSPAWRCSWLTSISTGLDAKV